MNDPSVTLRRARRGTDAASAWARALRLRLFEAGPDGKPRVVKTSIPAKDVKHLLLAITQYVDHNGSCFPSFQTLADDTEMSWDSIKRRLADLEYLRLVVRFRRWRDQNGAVNEDGRGRETSGEIRLLFETTQEEIDALLDQRRNVGSPSGEAADEGEMPPADDEQADLGCADSPPQPDELGCADSAPGVGTTCAPIVNPSLEPVSPQSPPLRQDEPAAAGTTPYERFTEVYGEGSSRPERARALWAAFSDPERDVRIRAARAYRTQRVSAGKPLMDPEKFLRNPDLATEFASKPTAEAASIVLAPIEQPSGQAWGVLHAIAGAVPRRTSAGGREVFVLPCEASPQLLALARFANQYGRPSDDRTWWDVTGQAAGAWREFVAKAIGKPVRAGPIMRVPRPFPPRIDGTWSDEEQNNHLQKAGRDACWRT